MAAFLKFIDSKTWNVVVTGWEPFSVTTDEKTTLQPEIKWRSIEDQVSLENSRTLNAIFNGVDQN